MNRFTKLRRFADKEKTGLEIAPYFTPAVAKADGYNVLIADILDQDALRKTADANPTIPPESVVKIEPVDIVTDACKLGEVAQSQGFAGTVDYIISSHNFEHLPDPISFLRGCSVALAPGGTLTMAIPDCRATFDHFRMPTRLADWLSAYHEERSQPSPETLFDTDANQAIYRSPDMERASFNIAYSSPDGFTPERDLKGAYAKYVAEREAPGPYRDAHCNIVFGPSFELMVRDLKHIGLIDLELIEVTATSGIEFFAYLRKPTDPDANAEDDTEFYDRRLALMRQVNHLMGSQGLASSAGRLSGRRIARKLLGDGTFARLRAMNKRRRQRRNARH